MKRFLSILTLILSVSISFGSYAQSDTSCVKTRWISVKNTSENAKLFVDSLTIIETIKKQVLESDLKIYHLKRTHFDQIEWTEIPEIQYDIDPVKNDTIATYPITYFLEIRIASDIPLHDEYGEAMFYETEDGMYAYLYPPDEILPMTMDYISEMRIREERTNSGEFRATGISFIVSIGGTTNYTPFTVNLEELYKSVPNDQLEKYEWYQALINRNYSGFQYQQSSCYDD